MTGFGLPRGRFALLFGVTVVAAAGNTAMQSLLPAIGRELGVADMWVALTFSLSAVLWVVAAPYWARRADQRGRRALMRVGLYGFILSTLICGAVLAAGLLHWLAPGIVFLIFVIGRGVYGALGSASPPAVQAYVAARTDGEQRTNALAAIASAFGLGTIVGPAVAPLFIFPPLGLATPMFAFAAIGVAVLIALVTRLPDDTPRNPARGPIAPYPSMGGAGVGDAAAPRPDDEASRQPLRWRDPRVMPWHVIGVVGGHGQAALFGVIGFLVIDRMDVPLDDAQQWIAIVLMVSAGASLMAQWWLIPQLALGPERMVLWGSALAAGGSLVTGFASGIYEITLGFAIFSLGFGFFRPGFTSGASLAVEPHEQNAVAGMVTSVNGMAYIAAPAIGIALYGIHMAAPFIAVAALMAALAISLLRRPNLSGHAG